MPIGVPPLASALPLSGDLDSARKLRGFALWPKPFANWLTQVFLAVFGWRRTYFGTLTYAPGLIAAQSQATQTVTITGARSGDMVLVRPTTAVNGIITDGTVTADDTVTVRVVNYSSGNITPASQVYNVLVIQQ